MSSANDTWNGASGKLDFSRRCSTIAERWTHEPAGRSISAFVAVFEVAGSFGYEELRVLYVEVLDLEEETLGGFAAQGRYRFLCQGMTTFPFWSRGGQTLGSRSPAGPRQ